MIVNCLQVTEQNKNGVSNKNFPAFTP